LNPVGSANEINEFLADLSDGDSGTLFPLPAFGPEADGQLDVSVAVIRRERSAPHD
jgi:hypothetical protein